MDNMGLVTPVYCPTCKIRKRNSNSFQPSYGKSLTAAETKNLICRFAKSGCINTTPISTEELEKADSWEKRSNKLSLYETGY